MIWLITEIQVINLYLKRRDKLQVENLKFIISILKLRLLH